MAALRVRSETLNDGALRLRAEALRLREEGGNGLVGKRLTAELAAHARRLIKGSCLSTRLVSFVASNLIEATVIYASALGGREAESAAEPLRMLFDGGFAEKVSDGVQCFFMNEGTICGVNVNFDVVDGMLLKYHAADMAYHYGDDVHSMEHAARMAMAGQPGVARLLNFIRDSGYEINTPPSILRVRDERLARAPMPDATSASGVWVKEMRGFLAKDVAWSRSTRHMHVNLPGACIVLRFAVLELEWMVENDISASEFSADLLTAFLFLVKFPKDLLATEAHACARACARAPAYLSPLTRAICTSSVFLYNGAFFFAFVDGLERSLSAGRAAFEPLFEASKRFKDATVDRKAARILVGAAMKARENLPYPPFTQP